MSGGNVVSLGNATKATKAAPAQLIHRGLRDFLNHKYPPRENVLAPWLPKRGIAMIAGWRGLGKTYLGLSVAYAIASGGEALGWKADKPRKVVYVDGEMDPAELKDRLGAIHAAAVTEGNGDPEAAADNLFLLCDGDQAEGIPDLAGEDDTGRLKIENALKARNAEVLMLDNLSALFRNSGAADNDQESWTIAQDWLRSLRRAGYTVVLFQHTTKPDRDGHTKQRGTSKKEDVLNTSILLEIPNKKDKNVNFIVTFTKHRGFVPGDPFPVEIVHGNGECRLQLTGLETAILALAEDGNMTQQEIADELHTSQSKVSRVLSKHRARQGKADYASAGA